MINPSPKVKKGVGKGISLNHSRPKGLVGFNVTLNCETGDVMFVPTVVAMANGPFDAVTSTSAHPFPQFWFSRPAGQPPSSARSSSATYRMAPTILRLGRETLPPTPLETPRPLRPLATLTRPTATREFLEDVSSQVGHQVEPLIAPEPLITPCTEDAM